MSRCTPQPNWSDVREIPDARRDARLVSSNIPSNAEGALSRGFALGAFAVGFLQIAFAQPNGGGRHFDEFIIVDALHGLFERKSDRRRQHDSLVLAGCPHIGE